MKLSLASSFHYPFCYFFCLKSYPKSNNTSIFGGCDIQFRQNKQNEFFEYTLVNSVRDWRTEWFYTGNVHPSLAMHSDTDLIINDCWEKILLSAKDLKKIKLFLEPIKVLNQ
jgi:hypothetical protein